MKTYLPLSALILVFSLIVLGFMRNDLLNKRSLQILRENGRVEIKVFEDYKTLEYDCYWELSREEAKALAKLSNKYDLYIYTN